VEKAFATRQENVWNVSMMIDVEIGITEPAIRKRINVCNVWLVKTVEIRDTAIRRRMNVWNVSMMINVKIKRIKNTAIQRRMSV